MRSQFGIQLRDTYRNLVTARGQSVILEGCTPGEIEQLKQDQGVDDFPDLLTMFLSVMGKQCGDIFLNGYHRPYEHMKKTLLFNQNSKTRLADAMQRNEQYQIEPNAVAFVELLPMDDDGTRWHYVLSDPDDNDPLVYAYWDRDGCGNYGYVKEMIYYYGSLKTAIYHEVAPLSEYMTRFIEYHDSLEAQIKFLDTYVW